MAKKTIKKVTKQLATETVAQQSGRASQIDERAAAAGPDALKSPALAATAKPSPTPAAVLLLPLTPRAALKPSQAPAQQVQKAPAKAVVPQASLAPAVQPAELPIQWEPTKSAGKAVMGEAPMPPASPRLKVPFVLHEPDAKRVSLSGEFNGWSPDRTPMERHEKGHWKTAVDLSPGRYQYKFIVDGQWIPDPLAHENVFNQHGTLNSVVEVRV